MSKSKEELIKALRASAKNRRKYIKKLKKLLIRYGKHDSTCNNYWECTCGFTEILEQID